MAENGFLLSLPKANSNESVLLVQLSLGALKNDDNIPRLRYTLARGLCPITS